MLLKNILRRFQQKLGKSYEKQGLVILNLVQLKPAFSVKIRKKEDFRESKDLLTNVDLKSDVDFGSNGFCKNHSER